MITSVAAIYATRSKLLQRICIPHADDAELDGLHLHSGESLKKIPIRIYQSGGPQAIQAEIGIPDHDGQCNVVHKETGEIIDRIIADPDVYKHPSGHRIVLQGKHK
jgi:hypothetical protein